MPLLRDRQYLDFKMILWIIHLPILVFLFWFTLKKHNHRKVALTGLIIKLVGAIALGLIYKFYYEGGDTWSLFEAIQEFNESYSSSINQYLNALFTPIDPYHGNPRTVYLIRFLSPFLHVTGGNYWILSLYISIFSFWASWDLIHTINTTFPKIDILIIVAFGFLPSMIFWTSGLSKDTISVSCFLALTSTLVKYYFNHRISTSRYLLSSCLFIILFYTKHYLAGTFFFLALVIIIDKFLNQKTILIRASAAMMTLCSALIGIRFFFIRLRPERFPLTFHELNNKISSKSHSDSLINFDLQPTWESLLSQLPKAFFVGLFYPLPWQTSSALGLLVSIENVALLFLTFGSLILFKKIFLNPLIISVMIFIVLFASIIPLTTPNVGSLIRYKTAYLPFFFLLVSILPFSIWWKRSA